MGDGSFWNRVAERAYFKYLDRKRNNLQENPIQDWDEAYREERIEEKIREESFLHYMAHGGDPLSNWNQAKNEIMYRLNFLAFYLHESNMNRSPLENWIDAQNLYLSKF